MRGERMEVGGVCAGAALWDGGLIGWCVGSPFDDFVEVTQSKSPF